MFEVLWEHIVFNLIVFAFAIVFAFDDLTDESDSNNKIHGFVMAIEFWLMISIAFYLTLFLVYIIVSHGGHLTI